MTKEQIQKHAYCNKYLSDLKLLKERSPFKIQHFGCGSKSPRIEHDLESIHRTMYQNIESAINETEAKILEIIKKI